MSHDLDDALRDSLRRHAESAPATLDPERIRARSRQIRRRRVAESVGAALAAIVVVGGVALAVASLRTDAAPGPVTSVPPTVNPTPSGSAPATYAELPWTASVIPYLNPGGADATQPYGGSRLVVTVDGRQTQVYDAGKSALVLVGWYGPDHRTLVYGNGDDVVGGLFTATFSPDGTVDTRHEPLTIDGSSWGVAQPLSSGGFSWVPLRPGAFPGANETVDYVDDSLRVVAQRPAPDGAAFVTRTAVAAWSGALKLTVTGDRGSQARALPTSCASRGDQGPDGRAPDAISGDGRFVALRCGTHVVLASLDPTVVGGVTELPAVPGGGSVIATWFDPEGRTFAASADDPLRTISTSVRTSRWNAAAQKWDTAYQQNVVCQVWAGGTAFSLYADKPGEDADVTPPAWFSETTPHLQVSPTNATLLSYGLTFAARTPVPTPSPAPTTASVVPTLGWVATDPRGASGAHPPRTDVVVRIGTRTVPVSTVDNALARPLGWYGSDHRTLVWEEGNGDPGLQAVTFRADGTLADRPHPLALPGVTPSTRDAGMVFGAAVAVPGDGFVVWSEGTGPGGTDEYIRVDDSLQVVARTPASGESGLLAASRDAFVTVAGSQLATGHVAVHSATAVTRVDLPTACESLTGGPVSGDGDGVPLWCAAPPAGMTGAVRVLDLPSRAITSSVLDGVGRVRFWWDGPTLHASTAANGGWSLWLLTGSRWSTAPAGTPVERVVSGGVVLVERATGGWYAQTDPEVALDSQDAPVVRPSS